MPITTYNFSANQPVKGLVSDLSTALEAYMEQKGQDLKHEGQAFKNEGQKYENMYTKEKGLKAEDFVKSEIDRNKAMGAKSALELALLEKFGEKEKESEINYKNSQTKYYNEGGFKGGSGSTIPPGLRRFNSLTAADKSADLAYVRGLGFTNDEYLVGLSDGKTMEDFKESARKNGVDVDKVKRIYNPTTANITQQKNRDSKLAETDVFRKYILKGAEKYISTVGGMSPGFHIDSLLDKNEDDRAYYLAGRLLQTENAAATLSALGAQGGEGAIKTYVQKNFGDSKVWPAINKPSLYKKMQNIIHDATAEASEAARNSMYNYEPNEDKADALKQGGEPSEEDITYTMGKHNMSREEVLKLYKEKQGK